MYQITSGRLATYCFIATLAVGFGMFWTDLPLHNATTPQGIISFELAYTLDNARVMMASWSAQEMQLAFFNVGLDFLFLSLYSTTLALWAWAAADTISNTTLKKIAYLIGYGQWLAGALDATENVCLLQTLEGSSNTLFPLLAGIFASIKIILLAIGILFILATYLKIMLSMGFVFASVLLGKK